MDKAICTVIITVASIAAIITVLNALMPAVSRTNSAIVASADSVDSRISTSLDIIHATGANGSSTVEAWAKNVGGIAIAPIERVDVFFGPPDNFVRIPYGTGGCLAPCWSYTIENDTTWSPTSTLHITVTNSGNLGAGNTYYLKVVAPNGISDARFFTV
jgi:archaeal flagellar protein FlaG